MQVRKNGQRPDPRNGLEQEIAAALLAERRHRPTEALLHFRNALQHAGDAAAFSKVTKQLSLACQRSPKNSALRHLLGAAYLFGRDLSNAEAHLRKAAILAPTSAPILSMLGDCLVQSGKTEEALASYRKAIALAPQNPEARIRLAGLLAYRGEKAEARDIYRRLIEQGVRDPLVFAGIIEVSDYSSATSEPAEYAAAVALAENSALPPALRRMLHFSAAKIDRARGRRDLEFAHYVRAKDHFPYRFDLTYFSELAAALKEATTPEFYAERASYSDNSKRPILIFGMPRSGTTLTEQILATHPEVATAGELPFFSRAAHRLGLGPQRSEASLPLERISERIHSLELAEAQPLALEYNEMLQGHGGGKIRVVDKLPGNFLQLWLIALLFRDATYIHCVRDPLATCFSCFTTDLGDAHAYTREFSMLAGYYRVYEDLMRHWARVLPITIFQNGYEELVVEPERSVRGLLSAARLSWDPACLSFHQSDRVARTASYSAVREPIHPRSLEKWRDYEEFLRPLKAALAPEHNQQDQGNRTS